MGRIGIYLPDDIELRLKEYVLATTGSLQGQSKVAAEAIERFLDEELKKKEGHG
jgi:hypothetical protein